MVERFGRVGAQARFRVDMANLTSKFAGLAELCAVGVCSYFRVTKLRKLEGFMGALNVFRFRV